MLGTLMSDERPFYVRITAGISVSVTPEFRPDQSDPGDDHYVWSYTVLIQNNSVRTVRLVRRRWEITDAQGQTAVVIGDGVIGEQPTLAPGDSYEYTSGCPLTTPSGMMVGNYEMETSVGGYIQVAIPAFSLDSPYGRGPLN